MAGTDVEVADARAIVTVMSDSELERVWRIGKALALSGMFSDARQAEQAVAKILLGLDLGLSPTQAMTGIHIVEGKPMVAAVTLASFVQRLPGYDYRVLKLDDVECSIEFRHGDDVLGTSTFTLDDAKRAGLVKDKSGWVKYPRNMLYARAMSNGVRWYVPEATAGIPVYFDGEIEETRIVDGAITGAVDAEVIDETIPWPDDDLLRARLQAAIEHANEITPGTFSPAQLQMMLAGQDEERLSAFAAEVEAANMARESDEAIELRDRKQRLVDVLERLDDPSGEEGTRILDEMTTIDDRLIEIAQEAPGQEHLEL